MKSFLNQNLFVILILTLGLLLRLNNYQHHPPRGASSDEYTYTFMGMSLLQTGVPTSWSSFSAYDTYGAKRQNITIDKIYFPLVTPYFDHPPLMGILTGGWALINGEDSFQKVKLTTIRQIPIFLGMVTSLLVYLLALKIYSRKIALWSLLIYSTSTIIVIETRTVFAENLLTPLLLLSLLFYLHVSKNVKAKHVIFLGILSGLSFWAKELGVVTLLAIVSYFILDRIKRSYLILVILIAFFIFLLYPLYGAFYNWELFKGVILMQGSRELGPNALNTLFFHPIVVNKLYFDGWYLLGFVSFFAAFVDLKKHARIVIPSFLYFLLMLFTITQHGEMGWYMIPLFAFFSILTAGILNHSIESKGGYIFVVTTFIGFFIIRYYYDWKFDLTNPIFRVLLLCMFLPLVFPYLLKREKLYSFVSHVWFYLLILGTIYVTRYFNHPL